MSDPKVEEIRARRARVGFIVSGRLPKVAEEIDFLLSELGEAEQERDAAYQIGMAQASRRADAAEERERVLIAGVREALSVIQRDVDQLANLDAAELKAILSRLLPSTPTEVAPTITIPRPHVPFGPERVPEHIADADYLRSAVKNIRYAEGTGRGLFGSNLTNTVVKLLNDAADAVAKKGSNDE